MGFLDKWLKPKAAVDPEQLIREYFSIITGYSPAFTSFEGSVYEMDLTRSVIHNFATHCSKLNIEVKGSANRKLKSRIKTKANDLMDTSKYLYRLATIREVTNNALIIPTHDDLTDEINGFYPVLSDGATIKEYEGNYYIVFNFLGKARAWPINEVGIMNQFQFKDELFGDDNKSMKSTLNLMHHQDQAIIEAIQNGSAIKFMAQLANVLREDDQEKEQKSFSKRNLISNKTGVMLFDSKYKEIKQIFSKPYTIDEAQMRQINDNVFTHFGTNMNILQNKFTSAEWAAYYEGKIEPFAIEGSLVHTNLAFSDKELSFGNSIMFSANRLQYLSPQEKLQTVTQLFDRGFLTHNQGLEIYNMPPVEGGDKYYIRKEYAETTKLDAEIENEEVKKDEV